MHLTQPLTQFCSFLFNIKLFINKAISHDCPSVPSFQKLLWSHWLETLSLDWNTFIIFIDQLLFELWACNRSFMRDTIVSIGFYSRNISLFYLLGVPQNDSIGWKSWWGIDIFTVSAIIWLLRDLCLLRFHRLENYLSSTICWPHG